MDATSGSKALNGNMLDIDMITPKNREVGFVLWNDRGVAVGFGDVERSCFCAQGASSELKMGVVSYGIGKQRHAMERRRRAERAKKAFQGRQTVTSLKSQ